MIFGKVNEVEEKEIKTFAFRGKNLPVKGTTIRWLSQVGDPAMPEYGLRFFSVKPGGSIPMHQHEYKQTQVIVSGQLLAGHFDDNGKLIQEKLIGPGDYFFVESMEIHDMKNIGDVDATFFCCICALQNAC